MHDALEKGHPGAQRENQKRHHEAPEVELAAIAQGPDRIGRTLRSVKAVEQQELIAGIDQGMQAFAKHR